VYSAERWWSIPLISAQTELDPETNSGLFVFFFFEFVASMSTELVLGQPGLHKETWKPCQKNGRKKGRKGRREERREEIVYGIWDLASFLFSFT
jgi:hypothetical protein